MNKPETNGIVELLCGVATPFLSIQTQFLTFGLLTFWGKKLYNGTQNLIKKIYQYTSVWSQCIKIISQFLKKTLKLFTAQINESLKTLAFYLLSTNFSINFK